MTESQDSPLTFPCDFPIKAVGAAEEGFAGHVASLVRRYAPGLSDDHITQRPSREGRYVSVTVTIRATSREQIEAIYHDLRADERVLAAL